LLQEQQKNDGLIVTLQQRKQTSLGGLFGLYQNLHKILQICQLVFISSSNKNK